MRRTAVPVILIAIILMTGISVPAATVSGSAYLNLENLDKGLLEVTYISISARSVKLMVQKDGNSYFYDLTADGSAEAFSLQMGSGKYILSVLENTSGYSYRFIARRIVYVSLTEETAPFLHSTQNVRWSTDMAAVRKAAELTEDMTGTTEKIRAIYGYMIRNIRYDRGKNSVISAGYIPDAEDTFLTRTGICYDYSSLFAAMLRSQGIPARLVTGYNALVSGYHAWNEVYVRETKEWIMIDTTVDAFLGNAGNTQMIKNKEGCVIKRIY